MVKQQDKMIVLIDDTIRFTCNITEGILEFSSSIGPIPQEVTSFATTTHSDPTTSFRTWHNRLGHAGMARIKASIPDIKLDSSEACNSCMKGKTSRLPFLGHFDRTSAPLDVVHGDIVGPITPSTNSGCKYFLTLVDQHTEFISVKLLKDKTQVGPAIIDFKVFFKNQTGCRMKKLITNGGGEFVNNSLSEQFTELGIQHNVSPPYTPQHNGVAERVNKTIINMARCMLIHSNLAKEWWGETVRTAMLVTNCLPSLGRSRMPPIEQMFGKQPNFSVFKPFGCKVWSIKPQACRDFKFGVIAWDGILIGYSNDYSSYRIVRVDNKRIIETQNVYFDELVFPAFNAINPSHDAFPPVDLPTFNFDQTLPFNQAEMEASPKPNADQTEAMDVDQENHEEDAPTDELPPEGDTMEARRPRLIIHGPCHLTLVNSSVDEGNILRYSRRRHHALLIQKEPEPKNHAAAMKTPDCAEWIKAEEKEISNMLTHDVWTEVPAHPDLKPILSTWAYKRKLGANNEIIKYKARICAQGFQQTHGLNFDAKYAPTGKPTSL
jgi:transposase InsO family protein